ncbi:MAG: helix-turn-helix domain-containing protein [Methylococcaceae bacterium]
MKVTQLNYVITALKNHEPVNSVVMFDKGITRLSAIIYRIRGRGLPILTHQAQGNGLAHYTLEAGWNQKKLFKKKVVLEST